MDTLVLDRTYQPVGRVSWQRAIVLWVQQKIEIIESYEDREVRSVTIAFKVPSVVRFLSALRSRRKAVKFSRENVYTRDRGRCGYCDERVARCDATYDHVVPRAQGGQTTWENVVICCVPCNQRKGGRTPEQAKMYLRTTPVRPKKLSAELRLTLTWHKSMPDSWRAWLRDVAYWHGELEK